MSQTLMWDKKLEPHSMRMSAHSLSPLSGIDGICRYLVVRMDLFTPPIDSHADWENPHRNLRKNALLAIWAPRGPSKGHTLLATTYKLQIVVHSLPCFIMSSEVLLKFQDAYFPVLSIEPRPPRMLSKRSHSATPTAKVSSRANFFFVSWDSPTMWLRPLQHLVLLPYLAGFTSVLYHIYLGCGFFS